MALQYRWGWFTGGSRPDVNTPPPDGIVDGVATHDQTFFGHDGTPLVIRVTGQGPPMVFLHGSNGGLDSWAEIAAGIPDHSAWLMARRGYGPSGLPPERNTFAREAQDVLLVVRAAAEATGGRVHLVGGSYGATVALHAAKQSTEHLASLALFEPPLLLSGQHLEPVLAAYLALLGSGGYADALALFIREVARIPEEILAAAPSTPLPPEEAHRAAMGCRGDLEAMAADGSDVTRWSTIDVPVLLMQGADTWAPLSTGMTELAAALPSARRVVWEGQSHFATGTAPHLVAGALRRFVDLVERGEQTGSR